MFYVKSKILSLHSFCQKLLKPIGSVIVMQLNLIKCKKIITLNRIVMTEIANNKIQLLLLFGL